MKSGLVELGPFLNIFKCKLCHILKFCTSMPLCETGNLFLNTPYPMTTKKVHVYTGGNADKKYERKSFYTLEEE